ncbi:uncharacterized protein LOC132254411 [Vitis vinifera]|uniref:uncharacterized protein LOC132254411 n=1 Tax=Vitis vinifera TaxID=29760 RepID=UPI002882DBEF|nr:uncharacterized protein LOC132254411 [Vitis vinifera]
MIKILSSSAEKIGMQLKSKGGETIKSLEIRQPEKPKPPAERQNLQLPSQKKLIRSQNLQQRSKLPYQGAHQAIELEGVVSHAMKGIVVDHATMAVGFRVNHHPMMAGLLGVGVTEAAVAAVNS